MASRRSSFNLLVLFLVFFVIANMEVEVAEGVKYCKEYSENWSGYCGNSKKCDSVCRKKESAHSGTCHWDGLGRACFCYFKCGAAAAAADHPVHNRKLVN